MALGIAMTLPDGILLIVDGRQTLSLAPNAPPVENVNKIHRLGKNMAAVSFGVVGATDVALRQLKPALWNASSLNEVQSQIDTSISAGWRQAMETLAPDTDRNHRRMRAALIVGGVFENQPFISGVIERPDGREPAVMKTDTFSFYMLGGEEQDAQQYLSNEASKVVGFFETNPGKGVANNLVNALLTTAKDTIRLVEKKDPSVGGLIRYAIIRKNFPYTEGQLR